MSVLSWGHRVLSCLLFLHTVNHRARWIACAAASNGHGPKTIIPFSADQLNEEHKFACVGFRDIRSEELALLDVDAPGWTTTLAPPGSTTMNMPTAPASHSEVSEDEHEDPPIFHSVKLAPSYRCERNLLTGKYRTVLFEVGILRVPSDLSFPGLWNGLQNASTSKKLGHKFAYVTGTANRASPRCFFTLDITAPLACLSDCVMQLSLAGSSCAHPTHSHSLWLGLQKLRTAGFTRVILVDLIPQPPGVDNLVGWWKEDSFTKLHVFNLVEYEKIIMMDADTVLVPEKNIDHLFHLQAEFAAMPEARTMGLNHCSEFHHDGRTNISNVWLPVSTCDNCMGFGARRICVHVGPVLWRTECAETDRRCFCEGVVVLTPSAQAYGTLLDLLQRESSYPDSCIGESGCNDQLLINLFFSNLPDGQQVQILPRRYNAQLAVKEMNLQIDSHPCTRPYLQKAYVYHWSGGHKPWVRLSQTEIKHNAIDPLQTSSREDSVAAEAERSVAEVSEEHPKATSVVYARSQLR
eukprot:scaffold931_cov383-Prasinococcus_capsulatus_cf.AAC.2